MTKLLIVEDEAEAAKVNDFFLEIQEELAKGNEPTESDCYCGDTDSFTDRLTDGVDIPRGAIVYVFREVFKGEFVWDIYKFGHGGEYAVSKDNEGDVAGLVNAGLRWFPF